MRFRPSFPLFWDAAVEHRRFLGDGGSIFFFLRWALAASMQCRFSAFKAIGTAGFTDDVQLDVATRPSYEMPSPDKISNSPCRRGDLFLTLAARLPMISSPRFIWRLAHIHADGGIEFRAPAESFLDFKHDTDFSRSHHENNHGVGLGGDGSQFTEGLRHHAGLKAHILRAHFASISTLGVRAATESTTTRQ